MAVQVEFQCPRCCTGRSVGAELASVPHSTFLPNKPDHRLCLDLHLFLGVCVYMYIYTYHVHLYI